MLLCTGAYGYRVWRRRWPQGWVVWTTGVYHAEFCNHLRWRLTGTRYVLFLSWLPQPRVLLVSRQAGTGHPVTATRAGGMFVHEDTIHGMHCLRMMQVA
jgi:hypothetical protein